MNLGMPFLATQCDLFACGVILYTLLVGRRPFELASAATDAAYRAIAEGRCVQLARSQCLDRVASTSGAACAQCSSDDEAAGSCRVSREAAAVIQGLLAMPRDRLTLPQLMQMPYMTAQPPAEVEAEAETEAVGVVACAGVDGANVP
jgi:hypothetical protein